MLKKLTKQILTRLSMKSPQPSYLTKFKQQLENEIKIQNNKKPADDSMAEHEKYLLSKNWQKNIHNTIIELTKSSRKYQMRVLYNMQQISPIETSDEEWNLAESNCSDISVYVERKGEKKWMVADFVISKEISELGAIRFITSYEEEKNLRIQNPQRLDWMKTAKYFGPKVDEIDIRLRNALEAFFREKEITLDLFRVVMKSGEEIQNKFYRNWLSDFRRLVD